MFYDYTRGVGIFMTKFESVNYLYFHQNFIFASQTESLMTPLAVETVFIEF